MQSSAAAARPLLRHLLLLLICPLSTFTVGAVENPFTLKAQLIRHWRNRISNGLAMPEFLLSKASPLTTAQSAAFAKLAADPSSLHYHLPDFCSKANLLCAADLSPSLEKHSGNSNFKKYTQGNFSNYGSENVGGVESFQTYSEGENIPVDSFGRYSHNSIGNKDTFSAYGKDGNVVNQIFKSYGTSATGGQGKFSSYNEEVNVPNLLFGSYSDSANGRLQSFTEYTSDANSGDSRFTSYGKNSNGSPNTFASYGNNSNVIGSGFSNYGESANAANGSFTNYGNNGNVPENTFSNYDSQGNAATDTFANYRDQANVGDDNFKSYGKNSNAGHVAFSNYGKSFNNGSDNFINYGQESKGLTAEFKSYMGANTTFKQYSKQVASKFTTYRNQTSGASATGGSHNKWLVEPGKFFREAMLKKGNTIIMPDFRDKLPGRSFLPRTIISKLPFSSSKISQIMSIFHAANESSMANMLTSTLAECERAPSPGETKHCATSIEDMIEFATSTLGRDVTVRTTANTQGYSSTILLGDVKQIKGVTQSVSCHQSLYPYLLYYCHSVPNVRVYEADILNPKTKTKINQGVAICHRDTSSWSPGHAAFVSLGSSPGKSEVCHWIYENDMTWASAH